jgi:hypothetical protein
MKIFKKINTRLVILENGDLIGWFLCMQTGNDKESLKPVLYGSIEKFNTIEHKGVNIRVYALYCCNQTRTIAEINLINIEDSVVNNGKLVLCGKDLKTGNITEVSILSPGHPENEQVAFAS